MMKAMSDISVDLRANEMTGLSWRLYIHRRLLHNLLTESNY